MRCTIMAHPTSNRYRAVSPISKAGCADVIHMDNCDCTGDTPSEDQKEPENPDLEDGEIEDDDDDDDVPQPMETASIVAPETDSTTNSSQILPAAIPTDTNIFPQTDTATTHTKNKRRTSSDRKSDKHLTEAEKCVRMLHKLERAERERRDRLRREQMTDDWAGNVEKAIASVLKKDRHSVSAEEEEEEEKKRGRKRKKKERERKKKHRKVESPKNEEIDEDEMLNVRGGSPENKPHKENSPVITAEAETYESYESAEYDSDYHPPNNSRPNKRNFERERKGRNRNRESRRERKNFREKNRNKKDNEQQQQRPQMQDANSICMFFMQGKCHKQGDECPFSHDALPPMKMELCKFYLMECCAKRDKCLYMHSEFPCKYYHTGLKCFAKDNCKFAHGKPLNDGLKQILLKHLETAPKEILGDFPRLSREGAQHMVNQTQSGLEVQYGIKTVQPSGPQSEKTGIPSLFDITVPIPAEIQIMQQQQQQLQQQQNQQQQQQQNTNDDNNKMNKLDKSDKPTKVRHTRWNEEPAVPVPVPVLSLLNPAFAGTMSGNPFSSLNPQDQQKIQEYQLNYQLKGFYSEHDQDMRINSNGDVDMRALPPVIPLPTEPAEINFEQYIHDAGLTSNLAGEQNEQTMDTDIRNFAAEPKSTESEALQIDKTELSAARKDDVMSDSSANMEPTLMIDEKGGDSGSELPSNLPKKQRELFLRIQAQQKENIPENQDADDDSPLLKDDDWYSSDDDNDPLSKMVIHLEDEPKDEEDTESPDQPQLSSSQTKPVEVIDKLGDLSKIDISAEVTKLLTSIKSGQSPLVLPKQEAYDTMLPTATPSVSDVLKRRDPRQAKAVDMEIKSPILNSDPRAKLKAEPRDSRPSIYEQGIVDDDDSKQLSIYEQGSVDEEAKEDVDLRNLDALAKDLDMRPSFGDTDLRQGGGATAAGGGATATGGGGRQDVDLRQLGLQFKAMKNYTPATEIDASHSSHPNIPWKSTLVDIPRPDYSGLKLQSQDAQVKVDPRLRKIFRVQSTDEKDSPASPKQASPPKSARQDPRRRNLLKDNDSPPKSDVNNLSYSQQLQLLQNSAFYQSLTSSQKVMLNQEIATKGEQNVSNDPILNGILSSLGLIQSLNNQNGCAMNILANVNSLVPNINPALMAQNLNMGQNMGGLGQNMGMGPMGQMPQNMSQMNLGPMGPNLGQLNPAMGGMNPNMGQGMPMNPNVPNSNMGNIGPGLLGAAPGIPIGPQMGQNDFQINFDPRNGGLLGPAPFQNFPDNQNFQYNDEFYPNNDDNNFNSGGGNQNYNNSRNNNNNNNDRNFRGERNSQSGGRRGRSWNHRNNNSRNFNRNNNRNRSNRSYTPP